MNSTDKILKLQNFSYGFGESMRSFNSCVAESFFAFARLLDSFTTLSDRNARFLSLAFILAGTKSIPQHCS